MPRSPRATTTGRRWWRSEQRGSVSISTPAHQQKLGRPCTAKLGGCSSTMPQGLAAVLPLLLILC